MVSSQFTAGSNSEARLPQRNRGWIWFFVILGCLTVAAIVVQVWFNVQQQLTPELLAAARQKWTEHGPRDYDLEYQFKKIDSTDTYQVQFRGGKVILSIENGQLEPERLFHYRDMRALFTFIEEFLDQDRQPGRPRTYVTASFDAKDGHLLHYARSVMGVMSKRERQEITVLKLQPMSGVPEKAAKGAGSEEAPSKAKKGP
jgi:hypothetical protein